MTCDQNAALSARRLLSVISNALTDAETAIGMMGDTLAAFGYDLDELRLELFMATLSTELGHFIRPKSAAVAADASKGP